LTYTIIKVKVHSLPLRKHQEITIYVGNTVRAPHNHRDESTPKCPLARKQGGHRMKGRHGGPVAGPVLPHPLLDPWSSIRQPASDTQFMYANNYICLHSNLKTTRGDITLQILPTLYFSECCDYHYHDRRVSRNTPTQWCSQGGAMEAINSCPPPLPFQAANFCATCSIEHSLLDT